MRAVALEVAVAVAVEGGGFERGDMVVDCQPSVPMVAEKPSSMIVTGWGEGVVAACSRRFLKRQVMSHRTSWMSQWEKVGQVQSLDVSWEGRRSRKSVTIPWVSPHRSRGWLSLVIREESQDNNTVVHKFLRLGVVEIGGGSSGRNS